MISGLVTTATSMPIDITKTRIQNMKITNGVPEYSGVVVSTASDITAAAACTWLIFLVLVLVYYCLWKLNYSCCIL